MKKRCANTTDECYKTEIWRWELKHWRSDWCEKIDHVEKNLTSQLNRGSDIFKSLCYRNAIWNVYFQSQKTTFFTFKNISVLFLRKCLRRCKVPTRHLTQFKFKSRISKLCCVSTNPRTQCHFSLKRNVNVWSPHRFNVEITSNKQ